jgi:spermidine/putrescine transport system substrate-binding protein
MEKIKNSPYTSLFVLFLIITLVLVHQYSRENVPSILPFSGTTDGSDFTRADTLYILSYPEYFPKDLIVEYERTHDITIAVTFIDSPSHLKLIVEQDHNYDLIIINDYLVKPFSDSGLLKPLDLHKIKNYHLIDVRFKSMGYDYGNSHSIPFTWGTVGLSYNSEYVVGLPLTWKKLFEPVNVGYLRGKISLLDDYRITMGILLIKNGFNPNSTNPDELQIVYDRLMRLVPYVVMDEIENVENMLVNEDLYMSMMWSGSATMISRKNHDLRYTLPSEGTIFWIDNLAIPHSTKKLVEVYEFINYVLDPRVIASITNSNNTANPVTYSRRFIHRHILNGPSYANPYFSGDVKMIEYIGENDSLYDRHWQAFLDSLKSYNLSNLDERNPRNLN